MCRRAQKASPSFQLLLKLVMSMFCRKGRKHVSDTAPWAPQVMVEGVEALKSRQAEPLLWAGGLGLGQLVSGATGAATLC